MKEEILAEQNEPEQTPKPLTPNPTCPACGSETQLLAYWSRQVDGHADPKSPPQSRVWGCSICGTSLEIPSEGQTPSPLHATYVLLDGKPIRKAEMMAEQTPKPPPTVDDLAKGHVRVSVEMPPDFRARMEEIRTQFASLAENILVNEMRRASGLPYEVESKGQKYLVERDKDGEFYTLIEEG